jgi:hypothetical protein
LHRTRVTAWSYRVLVDLVGETWASFSESAPEVADAGQRLLEDEPGVPGVGFLATVGSKGFPRIHPFIPAVVDGRLWAFIIESPKQRDLDRTQRFAIHSRLGPEDESFYCAGGAHRLEDDDARSAVTAAMPYGDIDSTHVLYEFGVARALWTTWKTPTSPVHQTWSSQQD